MDWSTLLQWYLDLWIFTIPFTLWLVYRIVTELLDLLFNSRKINRLLKHSDTFNLTPLSYQYEIDRERQSQLSKSDLMELERQINFIRMSDSESKNIWSKRIPQDEKEKITSAKEISDIFKIN